MYPQIKSGSCISAVDLIRGIGHYAGLNVIKVEGATGLADTNYEGKAAAAIETLQSKTSSAHRNQQQRRGTTVTSI